jgi:cytolysin (calcineurin-like family phosphatase)
MMTRSRFVLPLVLALAASSIGTACGGSGSNDAKGGGEDAGLDATMSTDASGSREDATAPADASDATTPTDAHEAESSIDAGSPEDASPDWDADLTGQNVTFLAFGDPQYGGGPYDKNTFNLLALNAASALAWPAGEGFAGEGVAIGAPRGVLIAGDLTQNGQAGRNPLAEWYLADRYAFDINAQYGLNVAHPDVRAELGLFLRDYGLRGGDGLNAVKLSWRVFEGYGNHDFDILAKDPAVYGTEAPSRDIVSVRNNVRATWPEMRRFAPGNAGHYSWTWDRTHFVHMNLVAADAPVGDGGDQNSYLRDPQFALSFLRDDLAAEVGPSCRPVIIVMHYGFDDFGDETRWWDDEQRRELLRVLRPYNVVALLHGHTHETRSYRIADEQGKGYDILSLGSPYYQGQATNGGRGHFTAMHIKGDHLDAADISWAPQNPDPAEGDNKDLWTGKTLQDLRFQTTTTFSGGWGGWKLSKAIDVHACDAFTSD